ncbi:MAG TPA: LysM domain-containing protein, partial [Candidatus Saccharimonadales bacterium]|nr:LysM domain-containing protein [Candidatus Saccharimonadales bacterium]
KPAPQPAKPADKVVTVQSGDNLSKIAQANDTTYVRLFDANDFISDPNVIHPGDQVKVPAADEQLPDRALPTPAPAPQPAPAPAPAASAPAPAETTESAPVATVAPAKVSAPAVTGNAAKAYIYSHESGNNPAAVSPNGCFGLGQDCNGVVRAKCGTDYACQDAYFTNYAISRYGSWDAAAAFWQNNGWW